MKSNQRNYREMECHVATMWQLRGLRDNFGAYVGLAERVSDTYRNSNIHSVIAAYRDRNFHKRATKRPYEAFTGWLT